MRRIRRLGAQSGAKAHARLFSSQATSTSNKAPDLRVIVSGVETGAACRRNATHTNRSCHSVKLDESVLHLRSTPAASKGSMQPENGIRVLKPASIVGRRYPPSRPATMPG
ncbi:DUF736 family protein [Burkholderia sp. AU32262]|nr:DUF736 family protein [Burkholderia sp. AU32262]